MLVRDGAMVAGALDDADRLAESFLRSVRAVVVAAASTPSATAAS